MSRRSVPALLEDLAQYAGRIRDTVSQAGSTKAFLADQRSKDSVQWNFVVLGEVSARLGQAFHAAHPQIPWRIIIRQRNVVAHGYDIVDWEILLETIASDIPVLIREAEALLARYQTRPETEKQ